MNSGLAFGVPAERRSVTMKSLAAESIFTATGALARGLPLERPLTEMERACFAIANAEPTNFLTLSSQSMSRKEATAAWTALRKRINRRKAKKGPLIYVAVTACSTDHDGFHVHALLWEYLHAEALLLGPARDLGFGRIQIQRIDPTPDDWTYTTAYALGQHQPVFGSKDYQRHKGKQKLARRYSIPHAKTLELHCPKLLSGLQLAQDESVSDMELFQRLPYFIKKSRGASHIGRCEVRNS